MPTKKNVVAKRYSGIAQRPRNKDDPDDDRTPPRPALGRQATSSSFSERGLGRTRSRPSKKRAREMAGIDESVDSPRPAKQPKDARAALIEYMEKQLTGAWKWCNFKKKHMDAFKERYSNVESLRTLVGLGGADGIAMTEVDKDLDKKHCKKFTQVSSDIVAELRRLLAPGDCWFGCSFDTIMERAKAAIFQRVPQAQYNAVAEVLYGLSGTDELTDYRTYEQFKIAVQQAEGHAHLEASCAHIGGSEYFKKFCDNLLHNIERHIADDWAPATGANLVGTVHSQERLCDTTVKPNARDDYQFSSSAIGLRSFRSARGHLIRRIVAQVGEIVSEANFPVIYIGSPFASGKSSLAKLLREYYETGGYEVIFVNPLAYPRSAKGEDILNQEVALRYPGFTAGFLHFLSRRTSKPRVLIVDEAQRIYNSTFFLEFLKKLQNDPDYVQQSRMSAVIAFAAVTPARLMGQPGETTPPELDTSRGGKCLRAPDLLLSRDELGEVIKMATDATGITFPTEIVEDTYQYTQGYPGLCVRMLEVFLDWRRAQEDQGLRWDYGDWDSFTRSTRFHDRMVSVRVLEVCRIICGNREYAEVIRELLQQGHIVEGSKHYGSVTVENLAKAGVVRVTDTRTEEREEEERNCITFTAHALRDFFLISANLPGHVNRLLFDNPLDMFSIVIPLMLGSDLLNSEYVQSAQGRPHEYAWQYLIFYYVRSLLPAGHGVFPEVGRMFRCRGRVDFYVNTTLQFLIEAMVGEAVYTSQSAQEHYQRFTKRYARIPYKQRALVYFTHRSPQRHLVPDAAPRTFIVIIFDPAHTKAELCYYDDGGWKTVKLTRGKPILVTKDNEAVDLRHIPPHLVPTEWFDDEDEDDNEEEEAEVSAVALGKTVVTGKPKTIVKPVHSRAQGVTSRPVC